MSRAASEKLVRAYYTALSIGDDAGLLKLLDEGVIHDTAEGVRAFGRDAFRKHLERWRGAHRETVHDLALMSDKEGRRVAAEYTAWRQEDGREYGIPAGTFFLIDERKILRLSEYRNDKAG